MKLIVTDIDGTILDSPGQKIPSERLHAAIASVAESAYVTCATGRSFSWAKPVLEAIQFSAPCIISGGAIIIDPKTLEHLSEQFLAAAHKEEILSILKEYPELRILFNDYTEQDYLSGGWPLQRLRDAKECYLLEVIELDAQMADMLVDRFRQLEGVTSTKMNGVSGSYDIHILNENATKEHAIRWVQEYLDVSIENTIGIGDGHNDFHIFNASGRKVAVSNAIQELKDAADIVIGSVQDDGVAEFIESIA